jgi:hypothetical protein
MNPSSVTFPFPSLHGQQIACPPDDPTQHRTPEKRFTLVASKEQGIRSNATVVPSKDAARKEACLRHQATYLLSINLLNSLRYKLDNSISRFNEEEINILKVSRDAQFHPLATTSITSVHNECHPALDSWRLLSGVSSTLSYLTNQTDGTPRRNSPHLADQLSALT